MQTQHKTSKIRQKKLLVFLRKYNKRATFNEPTTSG